MLDKLPLSMCECGVCVCVCVGQVKWQQNNATVVEVDKYDYDNMKDKCNFCPSSQVYFDFVSL